MTAPPALKSAYSRPTVGRLLSCETFLLAASRSTRFLLRNDLDSFFENLFGDRNRSCKLITDGENSGRTESGREDGCSPASSNATGPSHSGRERCDSRHRMDGRPGA